MSPFGLMKDKRYKSWWNFKETALRYHKISHSSFAYIDFGKKVKIK